ncbi:MAG TPA: DUF4124 domain-containing protein [Rhodanobacter sp.]|jgi:hypothetical protein
MRRLLLAAILLLLTPLAFAQVYKWTDAGGTVHYSETPPAAGVNYKLIKTSGSADPIATPAPVADPVDNPDESTATAAAKPMTDTPENRSKLCTSLKANLTALQGNAPVVMQQDGKNVSLDDSQRKVQTATAQAQYEQYCQAQ